MTHAPDPQPQPTDPAHPIRAAAGATFTIVLAANHTTGYSWQLAPLPHPPVVEQVSTDYQTQPHAPGMTGVGGWEIWTLRALAPHHTTLTFHYQRQWDLQAPPAQVATFKVLIH